MTQKRKQLSPRKNVPKKTKEKICDMLPGMCKGGNSTQLKEECQTEVVKKANRKTNKMDQVVSNYLYMHWSKHRSLEGWISKELFPRNCNLNNSQDSQTVGYVSIPSRQRYRPQKHTVCSWKAPEELCFSGRVKRVVGDFKPSKQQQQPEQQQQKTLEKIKLICKQFNC